MADLATLGIVVKSTGIKDAVKELDSLTDSTKKAEAASGRYVDASGRLREANGRFASSAARAEEAAKGADGALAGITAGASKATGRFNLLRVAIFEIVGPLGAVVGALFSINRAVTTIASFEKSMSSVQAVTRATAEEMKELRAVALELGETTEFSAAQAADGLKFLGMAGFTASEAIASIPAVLDLATASALGLSEAADISSNIMSGFGIEAQRAAEVADVLAAASSRSNTDVRQLGDAMAYAAPVAASLRISVGDTAAAVGVLSDAGIQGAKAGTGLRAVLASLVKPSREGQRALAAMGLTMKDVNPQTKSLGEIFETLNKRGINAQVAMMLFGREAASAGLALAASSGRVHELSEEMKGAAGEAERMAKTMRDNLSGDLDGLASAAQGLILALGDAGLTGALRSIVQAVTEGIRSLTSMTQHLDVVAYSVGVFAAGMTIKMIPAMVAATAATLRFVAALVLTRSALLRTGIGAAVVAAGYLIAKFMDLVEATGGFGNAMRLIGDVASEVWDRIKSGGAALVEGLKGSWDRLRAGFYWVLEQMQEAWANFLHNVGGAALRVPGFEKTALAIKDAAIQAGTGVYQLRTAVDEAVKSAEAHEKAAESLSAQVAAPLKSLTKLQEVLTETAKKREELINPNIPTPPTPPELPIADATNKAADAYARIVLAAKERLAQMELEEQLVGKNGVAADVLRMKLDMLHAAQQAGIKLTGDQIKELNGLADAYGKVATRVAELQLMEEARFDRSQIGRSSIDQRIAAELRSAGIEMESAAGQAYASFVRTTDQIRIAQDETKRFASGFISDILNGKSALESLTGALQKLGDKLIDLALDSAINSLFGNLLGVFGGGVGSPFASSGQLTKALGSGGIGLYAQGGVTDRPAIFGEAGPEAAVPLPDGRSIPVTLNSGAAAGGPSTVNSGNVYNFTGTHEEFEQFKRFVEERDRQFDARAVHAVNKGSKKNAIRV